MKHLIVIMAVILTGCQERTTIKEAKTAVAYELLDPSSAQFRNMEYNDNLDGLVCGEINGKNRMGAYTGFKKFAYHKGRIVHESDSGRIKFNVRILNAISCN